MLKAFSEIRRNHTVVIFKKIILFVLFLISYTITHAQDTSLIGIWRSTDATVTSFGSVTNTIQISDVSREGFIGSKTSEINNASHAKITTTITGSFRGRGLYLQDGDVLQKDPGNIQWPDCSVCTHESKMRVSRDSLILIDSISDCGNGCDGVTVYYRLLSEYDSTTQRHLADRFGRPADIIAFRPFVQKSDITSNVENAASKNNVVANTPVVDDATRKQRRQDSLDNIARIKQQQIERSAMIAQQKKRQQEITDSLNLVQQQQKRRVRDSTEHAVKLQNIRKRTEDSLRDAQAKMRKKEISDSLNIAKQKNQQRIQDSLNNVVRIRQQQVEDSTRIAQQKKRDQQIIDSLNLIKQKEQERIKDSLDNVARIRQHIDDSTQLALQKERDQQIADSLNLLKKKEQQRINDSLQLVAAANLQQQRTADSLRDVQAKKRQQEITDSLAAVHKQQYNDSLQKVASAKVAQSNTDTSSKALTSRTNVLLGMYHITTPDILIELFDNGEIDGDRVSVYHNNSKIVDNQMLTKNAITLNIHADTTNRQHEFILVAENLGSIPPNSALMRITVGKQIYKLSVNTDMKTNARIVFYYDGN